MEFKFKYGKENTKIQTYNLSHWILVHVIDPPLLIRSNGIHVIMWKHSTMIYSLDSSSCSSKTQAMVMATMSMYLEAMISVNYFFSLIALSIALDCISFTSAFNINIDNYNNKTFLVYLKVYPFILFLSVISAIIIPLQVKNQRHKPLHSPLLDRHLLHSICVQCCFWSQTRSSSWCGSTRHHCFCYVSLLYFFSLRYFMLP